MNTMNDLLNDIIEREYTFFHSVKSIGGRAHCQDRHDMFYVMRFAQLRPWTLEILESYRDDLKTYAAQNENPISLKYAYMMETTHPEEYAEMKARLPQPSDSVKQKAAAVTAIYCRMYEALLPVYPAILGHTRPLAHDASYADYGNYLESELKTYSDRTLTRLLDYVETLEAEGKNPVKAGLGLIAAAYGSESADALESTLRGTQSR